MNTWIKLSADDERTIRKAQAEQMTPSQHERELRTESMDMLELLERSLFELKQQLTKQEPENADIAMDRSAKITKQIMESLELLTFIRECHSMEHYLMVHRLKDEQLLN